MGTRRYESYLRVLPVYWHKQINFVSQSSLQTKSGYFITILIRNLFFNFLPSACDCNPAGSVSLQCNRDTGKCQCNRGMIGDKCDQCDADTSGKMPQCEVCSSCYYQWKVTLESLSRNISVEIPRAYNISLTQQPGMC